MIRVALVQMDSTDDIEQNLMKVIKYVKQAAQGGAALVAFPEFMNFLPFRRGHIYYESEHGRTEQLLIRLAREYHLAIHAGSVLIDSGLPRPYNQAFLVDPEGGISGRYSKLHLFRGMSPSGETFREDELYSPGNEIVVTSILGIPAGTAICYDFRFPELFRLMARAGAQIIFVPGNFSMHTGRHYLEAALKTRAMENGVFIVSANQTGVKKKAESFGHSMVIDPSGQVVAVKETGEGVLFYDLDTQAVRRQQHLLPLLDTARDEVYDGFRSRLKK
ncbi:nitrilase-related carbon-nitrogen hydrolase [Proteiniclasticum sp. QWL-01]|uniref:nitrilase-related carbon-nitrogen hydrolase n=1 Tax=Proteiniclasticum sp. QWL-01 TaxID=3036945 RepID=UPI002410478C|nr:nitrilase-related carbon-nitrogen hydrolase [Proteiniclasticum sp. QWL-01]WFF72109.1 nitrilase-related carbon-nitrogen hydrolase [Proteiniclasticum sp. QWL-01]